MVQEKECGKGRAVFRLAAHEKEFKKRSRSRWGKNGFRAGFTKTSCANLHDVVIILGFFAFFQWEFSLSVLAAVLAVLGYSVNESVIIFDRVREKFRERHARNMTTAQVLDHAITTTTSRTVITHTSTLMMVLSMLFFGGPTLHYFSLALAIGICFGVYSSIFVAAAIVMRLGLKREDLVKPVKKKDATEVELP